MRASDIHARLGTSWPAVLAQLGVPESYLRLKKAGPCPACGGQDRYTFDNRHQRGDFFCRQCGAGDGFQLLERVHRWTFKEALNQVISAAGLDGSSETPARTRSSVAERSRDITPMIAKPPARVVALARSSCVLADCPDAMNYLASRGLWPLPPACGLRAHAGVEYWDGGQSVARYPALIAEVRDIAGELVTLHVTHLQQGQKVSGREPRKILSPLTGREGCAVRLMPAVTTLGIAEGIETALAAAALEGVPTWAALNTSLLARFEPPPGLSRLVIFADRDAPGLFAAGRLMERLQGRIPFELRVPPAPHKDFNDVAMSRASGRSAEHV